MKVMAFNARPDERAFFDHFSQSLDMDLTLQKDTLTLDNVALTRGYDGISCTCDLPAPILEKLAENGVRYVALRTIGYDNVDLKAAERLGIRVSHAGYSPYAVSNYTVMLMLMCIRKAGYIMFRSHTADYSLGASGAARGMEMQNLTVGVIGTGKIGQIFIRICQGFGMHVLAYDPYPVQDASFPYVSLEELLAKSDIISLHCPLTDATRAIINAKALARMKPGAILINTARGPLLDEAAVAEALHSGKLGGLGVDVLAKEPPAADNPLLHTPNTLITPHMAWATARSRQNIINLTAENILRWQQGTPVNVVNGVKD